MNPLNSASGSQGANLALNSSATLPASIKTISSIPSITDGTTSSSPPTPGAANKSMMNRLLHKLFPDTYKKAEAAMNNKKDAAADNKPFKAGETHDSGGPSALVLFWCFLMILIITAPTN